MPSSLHVSLPYELRAFVDLRTNGTARYATPSEYVRDLIRQDMAVEEERKYVHGELLKSIADIQAGRLLSAEEVEARLDKMFEEWEKEDAAAGKAP